jgi:2-polyprenyl-3-methyl-5-hydroxy-6-metoxy-1,4-benzoquinol methylase
LKRDSLLHAILCEEAKETYGLDLDEYSLDKLRHLGFKNLYYGNAEKLDELDLQKTFEVVVAGDLLEHLSRPGSMLDGVKRFLCSGGLLLISTVNAFGLHFQLRRWFGVYSEHFEHVAFYSPETLAHLLERHGYHLNALYGCYTEPPHTYKKKLLFTIGKPLFSFAPVLAGTIVASAIVTK